MLDLNSVPNFTAPSGKYDIDEFYEQAVTKFDNCTFAEVGVYFGRSVIFLAQEIKRQKKNIQVYAIDTFNGHLCDEHDHLYRENIDAQGGDIFQVFSENIQAADVDDIIIPVRKFSWDAARDFYNEILQMVFIDAGHSYQDCKTDMESYWPKVVSGGWLTGHDYQLLFPSIIEAVDEFVAKHELELSVEGSVWKIVKP
jgi:predicted O-methyltransferase YrrM